MKKLDDYKIMPIFPGQPVGDPQISPDGSRVLFTYSEVNMDENKYDTHIWLHELKEKKPRQFTFGKNNTTSPRWAPNGKSFLFVSSRPSEEDSEEEKKKKRPQIYIIPIDGGEARQITNVETGVANPKWSPDGKTIMFTSKVFKGEKKKGSDVKIISRIKYKADGGGFYEGKYTHIFTVSAKGGKAKQITDGLYDVGNLVWSSDGKTIAFTGNLDQDGDYSYLKYIYTIPVKGGEPKVLLKRQGTVGAIGYSPSGKLLAFTGRLIPDLEKIWYSNTELWVMPSEGGEPKMLTGDYDRTASGFGGSITWSPDSKRIYLKFPNHGTNHIHKVTLEGEVSFLTKGEMSVGGFTMDQSGKVFAFNASDHLTPYELWTLNGNDMKKRTELNKPLLKKLRVNKPEEFWVPASDGSKVHGWIIKPKDFEKGKKYPTYGEKFSAEASGHWGERDYLDIMEATDYVIENYNYVDKNRLGVLGGSYGGFMTNWIVGHTDRYKAAVTMRSICNWYSFFGTSDIGWMSLPTMELNWGKLPWEDVDRLMEKSPITYVENMKTPLLIIHSENDYRCPMEQGEQLFAALKKLGRTVEFVRFPNEPHGLSRMGKPKHREERLQHIIRWFDRYL